jgi:hypothetical protein
VVRLLSAGKAGFRDEAIGVLRAGLETARWITVDDTGARHKAANGVTTQIGNDHFTWFATTRSKSRLNFLQLLRAGHADYVIDDAALAYMRTRALSQTVIDRLAAHERKWFPDQEAWLAHLDALGINALKVHPDPLKIATEGALYASVIEHGLLRDAVIVSDDAGLPGLDPGINVGRHALCWIHGPAADLQNRRLLRLAAGGGRARPRADLVVLRRPPDCDPGAYRREPAAAAKAALKARFERIFKRRTGFAKLDRALARLHANKAELLMVLDRPEIPLHTNGSENDIRCQVTKRKISGGTRSDTGRDCRDAFLSLMKTSGKLGVSFWDYLGNRLAVPEAPSVPFLPDLIRQRAQPP